MTYELHPLCTLFPRLEADAFSALVEDIRANGLREPITLHDGMILDGGNRYRACLEAGVEPSFQEFAGGNVASYVLSANLHRRHLTAPQRSVIVKAVSDFSQAHPPHRVAAAHKEVANVSHLSTVQERAEAADVSPATQKNVERVTRDAPDMAAKLLSGEVKLKDALEQVTSKKRTKRTPKRTPKRTEDEGAPVETDADIIQNLRAELGTMAETLAEVSTELEAYRMAQNGEAAAKEIVRLTRLLEIANKTRDQYITTCGELRKEVGVLRRQLKK